MKKFKKPLKVIVAVAFIVAAGFGMTSLSVDESNDNVDLLALSSARAFGENGSNNKRALAQKSDGSFCCKLTSNELNNCTSSPYC